MNFGGAIRLFRVKGIDVFLHWSWIIVAWIEIQYRRSSYQSTLWNILEYLTLFAIVLMHEFGHALATRSVGGIANKILLWPFGGIAFVQPPPRPGAHLWAIAAGPLVNVLLIPVTIGLYLLAKAVPGLSVDAMHYVKTVMFMNIALLVFNIMPFYPLDGGQILRSILWFFVGPVRSLQAAAIIGIIAIGLAVVLITLGGGDLYLYLLAAWAGMQCLVGLKQAKILQQQESQEPVRRPQVRCPSCGQAAPIGAYSRCTCGEPFDTFVTGGICPRCGTQHYVTVCPDCKQPSPLAAWYGQMGSFPVVFNTPPAFNSGESPQRNPDAPL
ncbi:MAG TPA: site-2 protease family protein [Tepidisphaeraceae bacterium]|jgi:Zn-dependent protease|nr:site-2 protease family protein [Tepidisphaeraceae bacterium]